MEEVFDTYLQLCDFLEPQFLGFILVIEKCKHTLNGAVQEENVTLKINYPPLLYFKINFNARHVNDSLLRIATKRLHAAHLILRANINSTLIAP